MKWYWWVLTVILALNAFVIVAVAIFITYDHLRTRRALRNQKRQESRRTTGGTNG